MMTEEDVNEVNEEAFYYSVLHDFIQMVNKYGYDKVLVDLKEMLSRASYR